MSSSEFPPRDDDKRDKKKHKKEREARERLEHVVDEQRDVPTEAEARRGVRRWLRPVMLSIDHDRIVAATKSSLLIAVNGLMLSITAHSLFRGSLSGSRWWALVPLALTNIMSLAFATLSSQAGERPSAVDELWPQDDEEPVVQAWGQASRRLHAELDRRSDALAASRQYLRLAYRVLLGGVAVSALTFAASLALAAHPGPLVVPEPAASKASPSSPPNRPAPGDEVSSE